MIENGWDEYGIVQQIAVPEAEPYLKLIAEGFGRFLRFKAVEESGEDTALDAALDLFTLVEEYWAASSLSSGEPPSPEELTGAASGKLMVRQSLVAGSTRINPLTGEPMLSHSIFARDNIGTIYQYELGEEMSIAEVWDLTDFALREE